MHNIILNLACMPLHLFLLSYHCILTSTKMVHCYWFSGHRAKNVCLMCWGIKVSAVAAVALDGLVSVQCSRDSINGDAIYNFLERHLLPHLLPFNGVNPCRIVLLDNASIHYTAMAFQHWQNWQAQIHGQTWVRYNMVKLKYIVEVVADICSKSNMCSNFYMIKLKYMVKRKLWSNIT